MDFFRHFETFVKAHQSAKCVEETTTGNNWVGCENCGSFTNNVSGWRGKSYPT